MKNKEYILGFTLIELLVVISIVSMLSSVVLAALGTSRAKAMDAKKSAEVKEVSTALSMYINNKGKAPSIYKNGSIQNVPSLVESGTPDYDTTMQQLVDEKVINSIPQSPDDIPYYYYYDPTKPEEESASFFTYLKKAETSAYAGSPAGLEYFNIQKDCSSGQTWNGSACVSASVPVVVVNLYPNGGETFTNGSSVNITWDKTKYSGTVSIVLISQNNACLFSSPIMCFQPTPTVYAPCSPQPCSNYHPPEDLSPRLSGNLYIVPSTSNTGTYSWTVGRFSQLGTSMNLQPADFGNFKISVCTASGVCETSQNYFTIN